MLELEIAPRVAQEAPKRPQEAPRGRQETPRQRREAPSERPEVPRRGQERFGSQLGSILDPAGRQTPSKTEEKTRVFKVFAVFPRRRKRGPKKLPKEVPGRRKWLPGAPRERPGAAQEPQRQRQERPRATQERPKSRPRGEQKEQQMIQLSFPLLGGAREASGSHFEAIGERFWSLRGGILEPFSKVVSLFSATPAQKR